MANVTASIQQTLRESIAAAVTHLRHLDARPWRVLIILGSGLGALADEVADAKRIPYADIPGFARSTVQGHKGQFVIGTLFGVPVAIMQGRMHFYEGYPLWQVTLPVRVARAMGATHMIVTNAAGGINRAFNIADVMLITDHINLVGMAGHNPLIGPNLDEYGPRFPEMTTAYDPELRQRAAQAAQAAGIELRQGVYVCLAGPNFETPAELRFLRAIGADAVGMSTVHEVLVARHAGLRVLGLSGITNVARLSADEGAPPSHEEVMQASAQIAPKIFAIVRDVLPQML
ncbi:MAG: purine-nucleoside phosphorylase [Chloroflexi bacterium]|uniref:Purine nucleoside phosphorylase n=1 Tax=Candidatus Thermofonsia Clade 3 bacterium TaxID=2364212 RepID=A0A2M8QA81_9CHLR|nr:MAG: purine-nucleoside phosphorylase [Candidatus Thermofonsia Clade 3 bacterium]RMG65257.1 MAG: purine-nucleoside phosphorylase [Chloroflexota bacterium]